MFNITQEIHWLISLWSRKVFRGLGIADAEEVSGYIFSPHFSARGAIGPASRRVQGQGHVSPTLSVPNGLTVLSIEASGAIVVMWR